ncbi:unnamed protein product [Pieris macdunnoughi]|uniref:SEA domain-containing protein n=1 Tax=Pieris macdunnoughi TaxID=345717 RepID=A0A821LA69_9NEOP|nr:unnamed protein product [Pieris macdunnoughi]
MVSKAEDIYWEGENEASNEFLEVDTGDLGIGKHLERLKRQLNFFSFFTTTTPPPAEINESVTEDDEDIGNKYEDVENEVDGGSGVPDRTEPEPKEKTLRVTFVVKEPYQTNYSNRDSLEFQNFSKSLAEAVNAVFRDLPGTHRASLVRIQSRATDEFSCKVTIEIVTTGYDDTDKISEILQAHIQKKMKLGDVVVSDEDFSTIVIDPAYSTPLDSCSVDQLTCSDGRCVPGTARCDGNRDCADNSDEIGCPYDNNNQEQNHYDPENPDDSKNDDQFVPESPDDDYPNPEVNENTPGPYSENEREDELIISPIDKPKDVNNEADPYENTNANEIDDDNLIIPEDKNRAGESPNGDRGDTPDLQPTDTATDYPGIDETSETCPENSMRCDETRCVPNAKRCDQYRDCNDGADEEGCPDGE